MKDLIQYILKELDGAPDSFQLLPYGRIDIEGEPPAYMDDEAMETIIAEFARRGNDKVIDYEHQTLKDIQAPAAGWIKQLVNKGADGLWAVVEWTEKAREYISAKEYRYFSPVFWVSAKGRKVFSVRHVALTNDPKVNHLNPIIAKLSDTGKEPIMFIQKLIKLFKLADDAGEDQVIEAAEAIVAKNTELAAAVEAGAGESEVVACKEVLQVLKLDETADKDQVVAAITGLGATDNAAKELSLEVAKLKNEIAAMKQTDLVQLALKEGKTSPEELDKWGRDLALKSPAQFEQIVLSRPAGSVIPLDKINVPPETKPPGTADETQLSINKMVGVSDDTWKKHNPDAGRTA